MSSKKKQKTSKPIRRKFPVFPKPSEADITATINTLGYLHQHTDEWLNATEDNGAQLKQMQQLVRLLSIKLERIEFDGQDRRAWILQKMNTQLSRMMKAREQRIKQLDVDYINKRQLRDSRKEALDALVMPASHSNLLQYKAPETKASNVEVSSSSMSSSRKRKVDEIDGDAVTGSDDVEQMLSKHQAEDHVAELLEFAKDQDEKQFEDIKSKLDENEELWSSRSCYICKKRFVKLHHFYDQLCPECATLNWEKRNQTADLTGKYVLLTGSRVKIGFRAGLKLLRAGATLIATSRFPLDTAKRYSGESDFDQWKSRLHIFGLDLRDLKAVVRFCDLLAKRYPTIDAIVNNAAQTVRRPVAYYGHLIKDEMRPRDSLSNDIKERIQDDVHFAARASAQPVITHVDDKPEATYDPMNEDGPDPVTLLSNKQVATSALMSQAVLHPEDANGDAETHFPVGFYDVEGQQLDLRKTNSWVLLLDQVNPAELAEVFAVNALTPFILNSRLKKLMLRDPESLSASSSSASSSSSDAKQALKFIVNVSAMEGKFYRHKGPEHPHTNMAKAALNMLTRTSAVDYAKSNIHMTSIDTGWINDENPFDKTVEIAQTNFQTPIDEEDAAARILDPILAGYANPTGKHMSGTFLKDYNETEW